MTFFPNATDFAINGGTFTAITTAASRSGIEKLVNAANTNAMHNSNARYDPPKCHPGTRVAILEYIMQWIFGFKDKDALILWLYGPAGAGKSAILQSIAEKCADLNILLASFFFSRSDGTRNHPDSLVATIAYQISTAIPHMANALDAAVSRDPMIFNRTLNAQIDVLIVGPLRDLVQSKFFADPQSSPRLILIDGLDECNKEDQRSAVLRAIARAIQIHNLPFVFLVSSRPETDIRFSFDSPDLVNLWNSLALDDDYTANTDIRLFLNDSFQSIKETHPMKRYIQALPEWPSASAVDILVTKSSGQFIYASTVIKYISAIRASPPRQLDMPFAELDALYAHILSSVENTQLMLDILAILMKYFVIGASPGLLDISQFLGIDQEDVDIVFSSLASITTFTRGGVQISHASLSDVLADRKRSGRFYIDRVQYATRLAHQGVKWFINLKSVPPPKNSTPDIHHIFRAIFTSPRPLIMSEELYKDLKSLPLDLIWSRWDMLPKSYTQRSLPGPGSWLDWHYMLTWLLPKGRVVPEVWYHGLRIKYATCLKALISVDFKNTNVSLMRFPALMETLGHDSGVNGMRYDQVLMRFIQYHQHLTYAGQSILQQDYLPYTVFRICGRSVIHAGKNAYIYAASLLVKSLTSWQCAFWSGPAARHYDSVHSGLRWPWITSGNRRRLSEFVRQARRSRGFSKRRNALRWLSTSQNENQLLSKLAPQPTLNNINSGKIYRIQRDIRLSKLQVGLRDNSWKSYGVYAFNRDLVYTLLIPLLDQCPKSDKLVALINRRIRHAILQYTPRRRLRDAVYRYIRRTSDVGSN